MIQKKMIKSPELNSNNLSRIVRKLLHRSTRCH